LQPSRRAETQLLGILTIVPLVQLVVPGYLAWPDSFAEFS